MPDKPTTPPSITDQLRAAIEAGGLSWHDLGYNRAHIDPAIISRFMRRRRGLTLKSVDAIAGALGLRLIGPQDQAANAAIDRRGPVTPAELGNRV